MDLAFTGHKHGGKDKGPGGSVPGGRGPRAVLTQSPSEPVLGLPPSLTQPVALGRWLSLAEPPFAICKMVIKPIFTSKSYWADSW